MTLRLISLGYEKRDIEELIIILRDLSVTTLLDVREFPVSRKKGFSKKSLSRHLENAGIGYKHIKEAGNPYHKLGVDLQQCLQMYSEYLEENPQVIDILELDINSESSVALLCYERKHKNCHRSILIEKIRQHGNIIELIKIE